MKKQWHATQWATSKRILLKNEILPQSTLNQGRIEKFLKGGQLYQKII